MENSGSVTLVFYRLQKQWWKEPALNIAAAAFQMSDLTHVEVAIGNVLGQEGKMTNVCRVFNDEVGDELRFWRFAAFCFDLIWRVVVV